MAKLPMDYSYILNTSVPQKDKLKEFGFTVCTNDSASSDNGCKFVLKKEIADGEFYVLIQLTDVSLTADVFETSTDEKYVLFNVSSAQGAFVGKLRSEVQDVIEEIREECFITENSTIFPYIYLAPFTAISFTISVAVVSLLTSVWTIPSEPSIEPQPSKDSLISSLSLLKSAGIFAE